MKLRAVFVVLAACGGQIAGDPNDASSLDAKPDAAKDVTSYDDAVTVVDVAAPPDVATYPMKCNVATTNLVAYYALDTDGKDHSGHGNDATTQSPFLSTGGIQNAALHFDGTTTTLHVTGGTAKVLGPRTFCAWVRPSATSGAGQPIFWAGQDGAGDFFSLFSSAPSNTTCSVTNPTAPFVDHWGTDCYEPLVVPIPSNQWSFVCYEYDGVSVIVAVDGKENKVPGKLWDYALDTLYIGSTVGTGTTTKQFFDGDIDEVSIWSSRLQPSDLAALWNGGLGCTL